MTNKTNQMLGKNKMELNLQKSFQFNKLHR